MTEIKRGIMINTISNLGWATLNRHNTVGKLTMKSATKWLKQNELFDYPFFEFKYNTNNLLQNEMNVINGALYTISANWSLTAEDIKNLEKIHKNRLTLSK